MRSAKIELNDLINLNDGTKIDVTEIENTPDPAYNLVLDEVEEFVEKPQTKLKVVKNSFQSFIPTTDLKSSIDAILKTRNIQEDRMKKHMQFEFDRKMQRINRIKSKTFRRLQKRDKLRKEKALTIDTDEDSGSNTGSANTSSEGEEGVARSESCEQVNPVLEFNEMPEAESELVDPQFEMVKSAFASEAINGNEKEFMEEKLAIIEADAPKVIETVLPGWDDWAGEGIAVKKTKFNTVVETKDGIKPSDRKDYKLGNVIINEHVEIPEKYKSALPYGYSSKEYRMRMKTPISIETTAVRSFKRLVRLSNPTPDVPGKNIKPAEFEPEY